MKKLWIMRGRRNYMKTAFLWLLSQFFVCRHCCNSLCVCVCVVSSYSPEIAINYASERKFSLLNLALTVKGDTLTCMAPTVAAFPALRLKKSALQCWLLNARANKNVGHSFYKSLYVEKQENAFNMKRHGPTNQQVLQMIETCAYNKYECTAEKFVMCLWYKNIRFTCPTLL